MKDIARDLVVDDIDAVEEILDKLFVYLENTIRPEDKHIWNRIDKDLIKISVITKNIKEMI
ncbi:hypothetical protein C6370_20150 [Bacillus atrophaeus]|nr:hypothetical protein C6370_20150 [Bacillus atrophaeus]